MKKLLTLAAIAVLPASIAMAAPEPKYWVCKYVGTPGVNEILQTGQNPISVSGNAITPPIVIGGSFNDKQGRSLVVAEDTGQAEPSCPTPTVIVSSNPPTPPVVPPTPVTPTPTPNPVTSPVNTVLSAQTNQEINFTGFQGK